MRIDPFQPTVWWYRWYVWIIAQWYVANEFVNFVDLYERHGRLFSVKIYQLVVVSTDKNLSMIVDLRSNDITSGSTFPNMSNVFILTSLQIFLKSSTCVLRQYFIGENTWWLSFRLQWRPYIGGSSIHMEFITVYTISFKTVNIYRRESICMMTRLRNKWRKSWEDSRVSVEKKKATRGNATSLFILSCHRV